MKKRVVTWVSVESIRLLEYDNKNRVVKLHVARMDKPDIVLEGVTGYVGVNVLALEAEADIKELGKVTFKFQGGVSRGIQKIQFPSPKPVAELPEGRLAAVAATGAGKSKSLHEVVDLQAVYLGDKQTLTLDSQLLFQKTVKLDLDKIQKMSQVGDGPVLKGGLVFDVALKSGFQKPLVLIERRVNAKKRPEFLLGLVGRVEAGYKLFPMQVIEELQFDEPFPEEKGLKEGEK